MKYLYHYYEKGTKPFRNLSFLPISEAQKILDNIIDTNPGYWYFKKYGGHLKRRKELENIAKNKFLEKNGIIRISAPHYLVVGESEFLKSWFINPDVIKIPISEFDLKTLSFCYGDIFPTFRKLNRDNKEYRNKVYTYWEIINIIDKYGLPQDWNPDGKLGNERYVEAHLWSADPIKKYIE